MKSVAVFCLFVLLSCQPQQPSSELSETDISTVMEATTQYGSSIVDGDFDMLRSLMDADILLMPPNQQAHEGIEAAMQFMEEGPAIDGSISPKQVSGSGTQAYVTGTFNLNFTINDTTQISDNGKYIEIWEKQEDGSWKVIFDIWNSNVAPEM